MSPTAPEPDLLFVTTADLGNASGPAMHVLSLVNSFAELGLQVVLAAPAATNELQVALDASVRRETCVDPRRLGLPGGLASALLLPSLWRHRRARVVYVRSAPGSVLFTEIARRVARGLTAVEFNGWIADEAALLGAGVRFAVRLLAWSQAREARVADRIRVVTDRLRTRVVAEGADPERVAVIPGGTQLDVFVPLSRTQCRARLGLDSGRTLAVFVGNLWPAIDLFTAIAALEQLARAGRPVDLLIVGDGPLRSGLEARAMGLSAMGVQVRFTGAVSTEMAAVTIGAADLALAPFVRRRNELIGLSPLKLRDYAACGRVVVASRLPGLTDLAGEPWLFLCEPESIEDMSSTLGAVLDVDRSRLEKCARGYAEANFGWSGVAERILKMLGFNSGR